MYLLGTDVIDQLRQARSDAADCRVLSWAKSQAPSELYISVITLLEIERGIIDVERADALQGIALRQWFEYQLKTTFAPRTLAIDAAVTECCARLRLADINSERNALLSATALVNKMSLVTKDTAAFVATGVKLINPWL